MRTFLALAGCLVLSGCFLSETAIYPESAGACPVSRQTEYAMTQVDAGGRLGRLPVFTLAPDGRYCTHTNTALGNAMLGSQGTGRLLFVPFENGWHIVQRVQDSNTEAFVFQLARVEGDRVEIYTPSCADFTEAALAELNIEPMDMGGLTGENPGQAPSRLPRLPPSRTKQAGPAGIPNMPSLLCTITDRAQLESALRAWIRLERPPTEYGDRTR